MNIIYCLLGLLKVKTAFHIFCKNGFNLVHLYIIITTSETQQLSFYLLLELLCKQTQINTEYIIIIITHPRLKKFFYVSIIVAKRYFKSTESKFLCTYNYYA